MSSSLITDYDYILGLSYLAKYKLGNLNLEDLSLFIKEAKINKDINNSDINRIIIDANYTEFSYSEENDIDSFLSMLKNNNYLVNFESIIHNCVNKEYSRNYLEIAYCIDILYFCFENKFDMDYSTSIKYLFRKNKSFVYQKKFKELIQIINTIHLDYYNDLIADYMLDNTLIDILEMLELETFSDIVGYDENLLCLLFSRNIDEYINFFKKISKHKLDPVLELINTIIIIKDDIFKRPTWETVFCYRNGIMCEKQTLEQVADIFGLTRERIRQIEKKCNDRMIEKFSIRFLKSLNQTIKNLKLNVDYVQFNEVEEYFDDELIVDLLLTFIEKFDNPYCVDKKYQIIYKKEKLNDIIDKKIILLPEYIFKKDIENYDVFERKIITESSYYRNIKDIAYLKYNVKLKDLYSLTIDEEFPDGFKNDDISLQRINKIMYDKYEIAPIGSRALYGLISRCDYCLVDFGTIKNRKYVLPLDENLKIKILDYLDNSPYDVVYYKTIFSIFENELKEFGINNRYFLKGLLDVELPNNYNTQKDYISLGENFKTGNEIINEAISKFDGKIDFDVLKEKFPGISDYTFVTICSKREDILWYDIGNKFFRVKYENIEKGFDELVKKEIESLFRSLNTHVITSSKIYSRMKLLYPEVMEKMNFLNNDYIFFSLLTKIIKDFYYRRPYISNDENINLNGNNIIHNYIKDMDYFNQKIVQLYCQKMHLRSLYSFLDFMIFESNNFIQVSIDTCINKNKFNISLETINLVKSELDYYINSFGPIMTSKPFAFDELPSIGYRWNKYLLVGFIRSYLDDMYIIEYTDSMYTKTDYIIRRTTNGK